MATRYDDELGTYTQWAQAFSQKDLETRLRDQAILHRGQLNDGNDNTRYTPAQPTMRAADTTRANRDDLEFRDWMGEFGFSGNKRTLHGPGMFGQGQPSGPSGIGRGHETTEQKHRRLRRETLEDGF